MKIGAAGSVVSARMKRSHAMSLLGRVAAACLSVALGCISALLPGAAHADPVPGSMSQVGLWQVSAYTRNRTTTFDHCAISRVQSNGFEVAIAFTDKGVWSLGMAAPDWGLTPNEAYTTTISVGTSGPYTFTGHALSSRSMFVEAAPEIFPQLKSGVPFVVAANQRRYSTNLDGIEAAAARLKDCVRQYSAKGGPAPSTQAIVIVPVPAAPPANSADSGVPSPLVASIQNLLARLGYDPGPPDGIVGLRTNIAISAFQKSQGEQGDGMPSEAVQAELQKALAERDGETQQQPPPSQSAKKQGPKEAEHLSYGTGFYIGRDTIITNFHVVDGCTELRIRKNGAEQGSARVLAVSRTDDLAALHAEVPAKSFLKLRVGTPIVPAESVLVFGYPLPGALSSAGNTTLGNVTALTGIGDDSRYIQISAAVQPGNSGGPVLDDSGRLMAVVRSKLDALAMAQVTGDIAQNVNFAIKVSTLASFLEAHKIAYEADSAAHELPNTKRAELAEASSTQLECRE